VTTAQPIARDANRIAVWIVTIAALIYALLFERLSWGGSAAYVLAVLPTVVTYALTRSLLAGAFMFLLPMYFVIGQATAGGAHYQPFIALDHAMPLSPPWIFVYGSLYMCGFLLPLVVVRGQELFRQTLKAYLFVMLVSYAGFWWYPTIAPRVETSVVHGFAEWCLQVFYSIDQPFGCFPSLHVAYSMVGALACYRMHRRVGVIAVSWAALIGLSTVYTKQHFVVDAIAGAVLGVAAYWLFLRGSPSEPVPDADRQATPLRAFWVAAAYAVVVLIFWIAYQLGLGPVRG
jgi:membrane-associated phospholipid phosphatase